MINKTYCLKCIIKQSAYIFTKLEKIESGFIFPHRKLFLVKYQVLIYFLITFFKKECVWIIVGFFFFALKEVL